MNSDEIYRLMIYFGVATLHFYRDNLTEASAGMSLGAWRDENESVMAKVRGEAMEYFGYELSNRQMDVIVRTYLMKAPIKPAHPGA